MKESSQVFAQRIRELRGDRSKSAFGRFLNISNPSTYHNYEAGRIPSSRIVKEIADKCATSVDWLLGRTESRYPQGQERKIGSFTALEQLALRDIPSEKLMQDVQHNLSLWPSAPPGRIRISILSNAIENLVELRERCADEWTGKQRDVNGKRDEPEAK